MQSGHTQAQLGNRTGERGREKQIAHGSGRADEEFAHHGGVSVFG